MLGLVRPLCQRRVLRVLQEVSPRQIVIEMLRAHQQGHRKQDEKAALLVRHRVQIQAPLRVLVEVCQGRVGALLVAPLHKQQLVQLALAVGKLAQELAATTA